MVRFINLLIIASAIAIITLAIDYYWLSKGFDINERSHILYLLKYIKTNKIPEFIYYPLLTYLIPFIHIVILQNIKLGNRKVHGDSGWATYNDLKNSGLEFGVYPKNIGFNEWDGAVVGAIKKSIFKKQILYHNGPEPIFVFAPTRAGKGVSLIIPTLLSWNKNSVFVLDIKGENFSLTSGFREKMRQKIVRFEPTNPVECSRFNPLCEIRFGTPYEFSDVQNIALMIVDTDGKGLGNDYWANSGWVWMTTAIIHCCYRYKINENRMPSLTDVYNYINPDNSDGGITQILKDMMEFDHENDFINDNIKRGAGALLAKAEQERSGVHSSGSVKLGLFIEPTIAKNTEVSDWTIDELMDGDKPVSCYIIVPPADIVRLKPILRIIISLIIAKRCNVMDFSIGAKKPYKHKLLLLLDEFTSIGKIEIFDVAIGYIAGYGLKPYIIVQDLTNLYKYYTKDQSIIGNAGIQIAFAPNNMETAKYISDRLGTQTIELENKSVSYSKSGKSTTISYSLHKVPLLDPAQVLKLKTGKCLIMVNKTEPIMGIAPFYYKIPAWNARTKIPSPSVINITTDNEVVIEDNTNQTIVTNQPKE